MRTAMTLPRHRRLPSSLFLLLVSTSTKLLWLTFFIVDHVAVFVSASNMLLESDRLAGWEARNYTWPPSQWNPNTPEWNHVMNLRLRQVEGLAAESRYNALRVLVAMGLLGRNLTEYGWGLTRVSSALVSQLQRELHTNPASTEDEGMLKNMGLRYMGDPPTMVDTSSTNRQLILELQDLHEQWVNLKLEPTSAYGLRIYRNQSQLLMHIDKPSTHVVSSILHIDHSQDASHWPLILQDYKGNIVEVYLEPGDLLFYESSRILHGRPKVFTGSWYTSLFMHYRPMDYWPQGVDVDMEHHYAIPPNFRDRPMMDDTVPRLSMYGSALEEPSCQPYNWCGERTVVRGPGIEGMVQSGNGAQSLNMKNLHSQDVVREEL